MSALFLALAQRAWPYALAFSVGSGLAWRVQEIRLDAARTEFSDYQVSVLQQQADEKTRTTKITEEATNDWIDNLNALHEHYRAGSVRLPAQYQAVPAHGVSGCAFQLAEKPADIGFGAAGAAARDALAEDCAVTTLQLLELQGWAVEVAQ